MGTVFLRVCFAEYEFLAYFADLLGLCCLGSSITW